VSYLTNQNSATNALRQSWVFVLFSHICRKKWLLMTKCLLFMVPSVSGSQGKIRRSEKSQGIWHFKVRENQRIRENQCIMVQKLTKMQTKIWTVVRRLRTTVQKFSARFAHRLFLYLFFNSSALVSSVIASDWKLTLVFRVNALVRENDLFCPGKSGQSREMWILQSSRNHGCCIYFVMHSSSCKYL